MWISAQITACTKCTAGHAYGKTESGVAALTVRCGAEGDTIDGLCVGGLLTRTLVYSINISPDTYDGRTPHPWA